MLEHYRLIEWKRISKKYLPELKKQFGKKPFSIDDIDDENTKYYFDEIWLGGGLRIFSSVRDKYGVVNYRFQVIYPEKKEDDMFTIEQGKGMCLRVARQFKGKSFYVEDIEDSFIRNNFDKFMKTCSCISGGFSPLTDYSGCYEDSSGKHDCYYIPYPIENKYM